MFFIGLLLMTEINFNFVLLFSDNDDDSVEKEEVDDYRIEQVRLTAL